MVMMPRCLLVALFSAIACAQTAAPESSAPPAVDQALRARIAAFYNLLVRHEYRRAEELVAPDARDAYYERDKPRYLSFELNKIVWSDNFTRAEVTVTTRAPSIMPMNPAPMELQATGIWRLLDGAWYWAPPKVSVTDLVKSMFGAPPGEAPPGGEIIRVAPGAGSNLPDLNAASGGPVLPANSNLPGGMGRPESMQLGAEAAPSGNLRLDRVNLTLGPSSSDRVTISNGGKGTMTLFILGKLNDVEATFDHPVLKSGEKAILTLKTGAEPKGGVLLIGVNETHEIVSLPVLVK